MLKMIILGMLFMLCILTIGEFEHPAPNITPPLINSDTMTSCYIKEIASLRNAANATVLNDQQLAYGSAQAFDRLGRMGQNC